MKPTLFIGSSTEGINLAYAVQENLQHIAEVTVWNQGIFELSKYTYESLDHALNATDFGVLVFTPDDIAKIRGVEVMTTRDNVVFELGLFFGRLGRERSFLIIPSGIPDFHLPTDLLGITSGTYDANRQDGRLEAATGPVCNKIRRAIDSIDSRINAESQHHDTLKLVPKVTELREILRQKDFLPDLIVGIARGGLPAAALLSKHLEHTNTKERRVIPVITLYPLPDASGKTSLFNNSFNNLHLKIQDIKSRDADKVKILIVDDVCRSGRTLQDAKSYMENSLDLPSFEVETAAISFYTEFARPIGPTYYVDRPTQPIRDFGGFIEPFGS
jgi:hypoxanthine phosphoribosyltransferase